MDGDCTAAHFQRIIGADAHAHRRDRESPALDLEIVLGVDALVGVARDMKLAVTNQLQILAGVDTGVGVNLTLRLLLVGNYITRAVRKEVHRSRHGGDDHLLGGGLHQHRGPRKAGQRNTVEKQSDLFLVGCIHNELTVRGATLNQVGAGGGHSHSRAICNRARAGNGCGFAQSDDGFVGRLIGARCWCVYGDRLGSGLGFNGYVGVARGWLHDGAVHHDRGGGRVGALGVGMILSSLLTLAGGQQRERDRKGETGGGVTGTLHR